MDKMNIYKTLSGIWRIEIFSTISGYWEREFDTAEKLLRYLGLTIR